MKIPDYPRVSTVAQDNVFLLDGPNGTKSILMPDLGKALQPEILKNMAPEMHRNIFRGKNLGGSVTAAQLAAIQNGSFDDLFVGDYWVINSITWRIVDINYWYNCGDSAFTANHLVIMPDIPLYNAQMNASNITTGGYIGSLMYTENLASAKTTITAAFGSMVRTHRNQFTNAVTNGKPAGGSWHDSTVDLPNEINMYGSRVFAPANDGTTTPYLYTTDKQQFALFALEPSFISMRSHNQWLRDVVSAATFARVFNGGAAYYSNASGAYGVRPAFAIG